MIPDAFLSVLAGVIRLVTSVLPVSIIDLPSTSSILDDVAPWIGPLNKYVPVAEMFTSLTIMLTVWLPAITVYVIVNWIYRHIPIFGGGG